MSTQIKKDTFGPLTTHEDSGPGILIAFPDESEFRFGLVELCKSDAAKAALATLIQEAPVLVRLAVHGSSQKFGDSYASAGSKEQPLSYAKGRVKEVHEQILAGDWRVTGEGGVKITQLARALARATGNTEEDAQAVINGHAEAAGMTEAGHKAWLKELRAQDAIKAAIAAIKLEDAEKAAKNAPKAGNVADLGALFPAAE